MKITKRSNEKEWMDLGPPYYSPAQYDHCLYQLDRVGHYLGGDRATLWAFDQLKSDPKSILDVGCGGGSFTIQLAKRYPKARVVGIDTSEAAIKYAKQQLEKVNPQVKNIEFIVSQQPKLEYPAKSFDVITSTLVCHHMSDQELVEFLKESYVIANQAIILNDLHRHPLASISYAIIAPLLFRNKMITHDGSLSIKRSFVRSDWNALLAAAKIPLNNCSVTWHWAFRWIASITI